MWPFDRKKKAEEAERKRQDQLRRDAAEFERVNVARARERARWAGERSREQEEATAYLAQTSLDQPIPNLGVGPTTGRTSSCSPSFSAPYSPSSHHSPSPSSHCHSSGSSHSSDSGSSYSSSSDSGGCDSGGGGGCD